MQFSMTCHRHTARNHQHYRHQFPANVLQTEHPRDDENRDRIERLEHLDVMHGEEEVRFVGEDERAGKEHADGQD